MSSRPIVRTHHFDFERARAALRTSVVAAQTAVGTAAVQVIPEPLIRRADDGTLWQAIRLASDALDQRAKIEVRTANGATIPHEILPATGGLRLLVPEVEAPTELHVELLDLGGVVPMVVSPQRHWEIHLVHHSHLDIGYTDPQSRVVEEHLSFLDSVLDLVRATDDWPDDAKFRWSVEALWTFDQWRRQRPESTVREFLSRVAEGRIELTALPFNMHTETCSTEELHELLRLVRAVREEYGLEVPSAMQTDVPGAVAGLVDALAENGVRHLSVAHNWAGRSVPHLTGGDRLPRLFRWSSSSGNSVLVWVTDTPHGLSYMEGPMIGFDRSYEMVDELLPAYLTSLATKPYPYDAAIVGWACADAPLDREPYPWDLLHLRVQGKFGDNAPPRRIIAETVRRWNETWAYPHLRLSNNTEFFTAAQQRFGAEIPTYQGDWNDWWADGVGSAARPMQLVREAQASVVQAQAVSSIAGLTGAPGAAEDTAEARSIHLDAALFDEHTWGAGNPWTEGSAGFDSGAEQWHWKYAKSLAANGRAAGLLRRAQARLGAVSGTAAGALASFEIVNTAGHARGGVVRAFLPESRVPLTTPVAVRDGRTGDPLPVEVVAQTNPNHRDAGRHLLVSVPDVPAVGTVRVDVVAAESEPAATESSDPVLDNGLVRVEVDLRRAGIASIVDLATGRELVDADATFAFNAYVYDKFVSAGGLNHASGRLESDADLNLLGTRSLARPAALVEHGRSPVREWLVYESAADGARWVRTTVTLWHSQARLDIENRIAKDGTLAKESAYFAFPFRSTRPVRRVEITGGVVGTGVPSVPGGAEHMRAMRRWVSLQDDAGAVAWVTRDAPLVEFGDIAVPYPPFPGTTTGVEPGTVYSWVHNNLWDTNFPVEQAFETSFAYSVAAAPAGRDPDAGPCLAARVADDLCAPLVAVLAGSAPGVGPAHRSWLSVSDARVSIAGVATPEPGTLLVRLCSAAGEPVRAALECSRPVAAAWAASYLGDPAAALDAGDLSIDVPAYGTAAVLLRIRGDRKDAR